MGESAVLCCRTPTWSPPTAAAGALAIASSAIHCMRPHLLIIQALQMGRGSDEGVNRRRDDGVGALDEGARH